MDVRVVLASSFKASGLRCAPLGCTCPEHLSKCYVLSLLIALQRLLDAISYILWRSFSFSLGGDGLSPGLLLSVCNGADVLT